MPRWRTRSVSAVQTIARRSDMPAHAPASPVASQEALGASLMQTLLSRALSQLSAHDSLEEGQVIEDERTIRVRARVEERVEAIVQMRPGDIVVCGICTRESDGTIICRGSCC